MWLVLWLCIVLRIHSGGWQWCILEDGDKRWLIGVSINQRWIGIADTMVFVDEVNFPFYVLLFAETNAQHHTLQTYFWKVEFASWIPLYFLLVFSICKYNIHHAINSLYVLDPRWINQRIVKVFETFIYKLIRGAVIEKILLELIYLTNYYLTSLIFHHQ
jgi:hypothetical protein